MGRRAVTDEKKRGGARPGAGRPKGRKKSDYLNVRLAPEDMDKFRELCKSRKTSQAKQIREWIRSDRP